MFSDQVPYLHQLQSLTRVIVIIHVWDQLHLVLPFTQIAVHVRTKCDTWIHYVSMRRVTQEGTGDVTRGMSDVEAHRVTFGKCCHHPVVTSSSGHSFGFVSPCTAPFPQHLWCALSNFPLQSDRWESSVWGQIIHMVRPCCCARAQFHREQHLLDRLALGSLALLCALCINGPTRIWVGWMSFWLISFFF